MEQEVQRVPTYALSPHRKFLGCALVTFQGQKGNILLFKEVVCFLARLTTLSDRVEGECQTDHLNLQLQRPWAWHPAEAPYAHCGPDGVTGGVTGPPRSNSQGGLPTAHNFKLYVSSSGKNMSLKDFLSPNSYLFKVLLPLYLRCVLARPSVTYI